MASRGFTVVRIALALLLLAAAGLKTHELLTYPVFGSGWLDSRWVQIAIIEFEIFLGLWLLFGLFPRLLWSVALACFSTFTLVTLYKGLTGEASCGCFGRWEVSPWWTLGLDAVAVAALVWWRPRSGAKLGAEGSSRLGRLIAGTMGAIEPAESRAVAPLLSLVILIGVPVGWRLATHEAAALDDLGYVSADGSFVVLEPGQWVGRPFALLPYTDLGSEVTEGTWTVVLVRPGCANCEQLLAGWPAIAGRFSCEDGADRIAVLTIGEVLPERYRQVLQAHAYGLLDAGKSWLVETPVTVTLQQGTVATLVSLEELFGGNPSGSASAASARPGWAWQGCLCSTGLS